MNLPIKVKLSGSQSMLRYGSFLTTNERNVILQDLGAKLKYLTIQNFGFTGTDRPTAWPRLSPKYANRVKRTEATLEKSGDLLRSLRVGQPDGNSISVSTDSEYAEVHQRGFGNTPPRPFFPVTRSGDLTPRAQRILDTTAAQSLQRLMKGHVK